MSALNAPRTIAGLFLIALFTTAALTGTMTVAQAGTPATADEVVKQAEADAKRQHKNLFVYFHASWCPWCRRMEKLLADPTYSVTELKELGDYCRTPVRRVPAPSAPTGLSEPAPPQH